MREPFFLRTHNFVISTEGEAEVEKPASAFTKYCNRVIREQRAATDFTDHHGSDP